MENQSTRRLENDLLRSVVDVAKQRGYKVYTFESSGIWIKQVFFENLKNEIGTCQSYFSGIKFGTMHKPNKICGTGFGNVVGDNEFDNPEDIDHCFIHSPFWARSYNESVIKWKSWAEYINKPTSLKYYEI